VNEHESEPETQRPDTADTQGHGSPKKPWVAPQIERVDILDSTHKVFTTTEGTTGVFGPS